MADNNRPSNFLRRLVRPAPRVFVPLLYTNIYPEVFDPPAIFRPAAAPALAAAAPAPAAAAAPAPAAAAAPAPAAAAPAPPAAAPATEDVPMPSASRCPSPASSVLSELSEYRMESEEPTTRLSPQPRLRRWSLSGGEVIDPPKKAPTKLDVVILIEELYKLGTRNEAEEKYLEFRNLIDNLAKAKLVRDQTLTKQDPDKLQELFKKLGETYPWFARTDGWPARPYLLDRQRNQTKRTTVKKNQAAHMAVKKAFSSVSRPSSSTVHKKATPLSLRKTRSMGGSEKSSLKSHGSPFTQASTCTTLGAERRDYEVKPTACCGQVLPHAPGSDTRAGPVLRASPAPCAWLADLQPKTRNPTQDLQPDPRPSPRDPFDYPTPLTARPSFSVFLSTFRARHAYLVEPSLYIPEGPSPLLPRDQNALRNLTHRFPRFPRIEDNFNDHDLQTHIHDFKIVLRHGNKETPFRVFAKRGQSIPVNLSSTAGNAGAIPFPGAVPNGAAIPNGGVFQLFGTSVLCGSGRAPMETHPSVCGDATPAWSIYIRLHENRIVPPKVLVVTRPRAFPK
ncbi:hypothetical protein K438DRAFT_1786867 [Mycena galopus ATCC 62051]|nr:hypothetical protein K438DRAFT_1786867 [Mycena galopus ATCC 62051]